MEIGRHRADLLRIARFQLRDGHTAEDVVQETLLAALGAMARYEGRSSVRSWLIGILKFKIVDALRAQMRAPGAFSDLHAESGTDDIDTLFDGTGTWSAKPRDWDDPGRAVRHGDFERVLEACLAKLPERCARVFVLREMFEMEADEVCEVASVTRNHLNVLLFRARMSLRRCLDLNWVSDR